MEWRGIGRGAWLRGRGRGLRWWEGLTTGGVASRKWEWFGIWAWLRGSRRGLGRGAELRLEGRGIGWGRGFS